jgi:ATP-binding cassette subfamily F protein uup
MSHLITLKNISKAYGPRPLFTDLNLSINIGDRLGIIGPNGAGKSTLLQLLAGKDVADEGDVIAKRELRIGYISQRDQFEEGQTVREIFSALDTHNENHVIGVGKSISEIKDVDVKISALSGGWRKRIAIAAAIIAEPDLLLLDEPTNHLDLETIEWLENLIVKQTIVIITHDRSFLERTANHIMEISPRYRNGYFTASGRYSTFLEKRAEHLEGASKYEQALKGRVKKELEWLSRQPKARATKAAYRVEQAENLASELSEVSSRNRDRRATFDFSATNRKTKELIVFENVGKSYSSRCIVQDLSLKLNPGTRLGMLGRNGSGKSTVMKLLNGEITPDKGIINRASQLKIISFDQDRRSLNPKLSLKNTLSPDGDTVFFNNQPIHVAGWARRFLFEGDKLDTPVGSLSGGEQARLLLARLMLQPADVLLLDEPTNDLDIDTLDVFEESLEEFPGAIVLITHDRFMLERVSERFLVLLGDGETEFVSSLSQFYELKKSEKKPKGEAKPEKSTAKLSSKEKKELDKFPELIQKLEEEQTALQEKINSAPPEKIQELCIAFEELRIKTEESYERWNELEGRVRG